MNVEYEEFETVEDLLLYMSSATPAMKNVNPVSNYKGYVFSIIPLNPSSGDSYAMVYTKGELEGTLLEFDINSKKYKAVTAAERSDKIYFVVLRPKRNTLADQCIEELSSS